MHRARKPCCPTHGGSPEPPSEPPAREGRAVLRGARSPEELPEASPGGLPGEAPTNPASHSSLLHGLRVPEEPRDRIQQATRGGDSVPPASRHDASLEERPASHRGYGLAPTDSGTPRLREGRCRRVRHGPDRQGTVRGRQGALVSGLVCRRRVIDRIHGRVGEIQELHRLPGRQLPGALRMNGEVPKNGQPLDR